ncbi:phosphatase PAP2 family protein [Arsenicitalea aurantiaca]|nr:phosphatase PAP2 family protein [Arsenicitalea aurantiaca]
MLIASVVLFGAFCLLAVGVLQGALDGIDLAIMNLLRNPDAPDALLGPTWLHEMGRDVTALGSLSVLFLVTGTSFAYLLVTGRTRLAAFLAGAFGGAFLLSFALKELVGRPRPEFISIAEVFTPSFPSAHASLSAATFLSVGLLLTRAEPGETKDRYVIGVAIVLTLLVGLSRLYLGLHYPSDILAGWMLGAGWVCLCWWYAERREHRAEIALAEARRY